MAPGTVIKYGDFTDNVFDALRKVLKKEFHHFLEKNKDI